jgi:hypothetical protein
MVFLLLLLLSLFSLATILFIFTALDIPPLTSALP